MIHDWPELDPYSRRTKKPGASTRARRLVEDYGWLFAAIAKAVVVSVVVAAVVAVFYLAGPSEETLRRIELTNRVDSLVDISLQCGHYERDSPGVEDDVTAKCRAVRDDLRRARSEKLELEMRRAGR